MQVNRRWVWLGALVVAVAIAVGVVPSLRVEERVMWLASQPGDTTAFQHPESGRSDALIALISAAVLSPIALFGLVLVFLLLVRMFQSLLATIRLPEWLSAPTVGMVSIATMYATTPLWLPPSLSALGLLARAYLVFSQTNPPLFH
ncbi:MAG: hypothetical protein DMD78_11070 [Candidatus Rokuibacteriota bacterium]|nr:MAG: hypothetical protein DMD78_11070 [Candidatus Rokubacteria bacterium]